MRKTAIGILALGLVLAACGGKSAFELAVGDCFDDPSSFENVETVPEKACSEPHDNEVYANLTLTGGEWPGLATVEEWADEQCYTEFEQYVGASYEESILDFGWLVPTERSWNEIDDRTVTCILYDANLAKLEGSMKGSGQ